MPTSKPYRYCQDYRPKYNNRTRQAQSVPIKGF
jgi:hypothetical protein